MHKIAFSVVMWFSKHALYSADHAFSILSWIGNQNGELMPIVKYVHHRKSTLILSFSNHLQKWSCCFENFRRVDPTRTRFKKLTKMNHSSLRSFLFVLLIAIVQISFCYTLSLSTRTSPRKNVGLKVATGMVPPPELDEMKITSNSKKKEPHEQNHVK